MSDPTMVNIIDRDGNMFAVPADQVDATLRSDRTLRVEGEGEAFQRAAVERRTDPLKGPLGAAVAVPFAVARGVSLGGSDVLLDAVGGGEFAGDLRNLHPELSIGAEIVGAVATGRLPSPASLAQRAGAAVARTADGASTAVQLGRAAAGAATEGVIMGAGSGVSELALSKDPVTVERMASVLSSHALFGAGVGAGAGVFAKAAERGLARARGALDEFAAARSAPELAGDLSKLDAKGLRAAEKAELEAIEAARVGQRKDVADEIAAFRREVKEQKHFLTTDGITLPQVEGKLSAGELGRKAVKALRQLDNALDNPIGLAKNPGKALDALQRHEDSLVKLLDRADELRSTFKADKSLDRMKALDAIAPALEKNRALQAKLGELAAAPTSSRLSQIADAKDALAAGGARQGIAEQMLGGTIFGKVSELAGAIPVLGPMIGARAARFATDLVFGRMQNAAAEQAARVSKALGSFLDVAKKASPAAPVLASKVFSSVAFSEPSDADVAIAPKKKGTTSLAAGYKARTDEIKQLTQYDATGRAVMRPAARAAMAKRLDPIRAIDPKLADQIETIRARGIEFIANHLPRRPDLGGIPIGPDRWQPNDLEMRRTARIIAAVEDPHGIVERLVDGSITPEDAQVMREVYPEMYLDIQQRILAELPTLRATLPYQKRLAFSIFSGLPVDAAMHPDILEVLQGQYAIEPGTDGGAHAPVAQAQFGSVSSTEKATPAQERAG